MQDFKMQDWVVLDNRNNLDPAVNLAIEEYAVRHLPADRSYFFIYRNQPSVIVGKHQNVLLEVNLPYCWENQIPILRRISGGGTVFHDPGNLNLSFITQYTLKNFNHYRTFLQPVVEFFKRYDVRIEIDERNNLRLNEKKISGNAQFTSRNRMLSHGTLLVNSDLELLRHTLKKTEAEKTIIKTHATASVKSPVTNIASEAGIEFDVDFIAEKLKEIFSGQAYTKYSFSDSEWAEINRLAVEKYQTWEWNIAESPQVSIEKTVSFYQEPIFWKYKVERGIFRNVEIVNQDLKFLTEQFESQKLNAKLWNNLRKIVTNAPDEKKAKIKFFVERWF